MKGKLMSQKNNQNSKPESHTYIFYLDTSEKEARIGLFRDQKLIAEEKWEAYRELSTTLSSNYQKLLKTAKISQENLSGICVFPGPGSFTGLRIGISFANALAYALRIPVYKTDKKDKINTFKPQKIIIPGYGAPPKITKPKK